MMRLPRFEYLQPRTVGEAARMLADLGPEAQVVAGGTDLYPKMKRRQQTPSRVIGLRGIESLHGAARRERGGLTIPAMASLTRVERDPALAAAWPALGRAVRTISTPPLRNMGTLGGNLCLDTRCNYYDQSHEWRRSIDFCLKKDGGVCWVAPGSSRCWAVSSSDSAPLLCALAAEVTLASADGERRIPVEQLFADDGIRYLTKRSDEILTAIHLPEPGEGARRTRATYWKLRRRGAFDFPVLGVGAAVRLSSDGVVEHARLFLGGTGSRPHEAAAAARQLLGRRLDDEETIREVAAAAARLAKPLDNTDFVLGWRKEMARHHVAGALRELASSSGPSTNARGSSMMARHVHPAR